MNTNALLRLTYPVGHRRAEARLSGPERSAAEAIPLPNPKAGLVVALLSSLGLWAAIWLALSSLASAWLR
jgi:hypothetical protein